MGSAGVPRHWGHAALLAHAKKRVIRVKFRPLERGAETDGADDRKAGGAEGLQSAAPRPPAREPRGVV